MNPLKFRPTFPYFEKRYSFISEVGLTLIGNVRETVYTSLTNFVFFFLLLLRDDKCYIRWLDGGLNIEMTKIFMYVG